MPHIHDLRGTFFSRTSTFTGLRPSSVAVLTSRTRLAVAGALSLLLAGCPGEDGMVIADEGGATDGSEETDGMTDDGMAEAGTPMATTDAATGTGGEEETEGADESSGDGSTANRSATLSAMSGTNNRSTIGSEA